MALNIFVCVKQVPDIRSNITPNINATYIKTESLRWGINPEDECAVEQALLIREQIPSTSIVAIRVGAKQNSEALISAMAMGADKSILVRAEEERLDPFMTAKALKGAIESSEGHPDLVLCGNKSFGDESNQVPQILAQLLDLSCVTRVSKFSISDSRLKLERQIERGAIERYTLNLPAVVAYNYGINTPRYAPLPHVQAAYKKPLTELGLKETLVSHNDRRLRYFNYRPAPEKKTGEVFYAVDKTGLGSVVEEVVETLYSDLGSLLGSAQKK